MAKYKFLNSLFILVIALIVTGCSQDSATDDESSSEATQGKPVTEASADTILTNAKVYTVDANKPWAESVAIKGDRIIAVGSNAEISSLRGESTQQIDLAGRFVMPGFTDSHVHFMAGGKYLSNVPLREARTLAEVLQLIVDYAEAHPDKEWITGEGFVSGYPDLPNGELHKDLLDKIVPDRPVFLTSGLLHAGWANSKALELAGITKETPHPESGEIVRDANNEPSGLLKESARLLFNDFIPQATNEDELNWLKSGINQANRFGITRVISAGGDTPHVEQLDELRKSGELSLRFSLSKLVAPGMGPQDLSEGWYQSLESNRDKYQDEFISAGIVKFFMDGIVETRTGYLPDGYADNPEETGMVFWEQDAFNQVVLELHKRGFQIMTHALGDGASKRALDAYEAAQAVDGKQLRHRIEHAEAPYAKDIPRFKELDVMVSSQPIFIYPADIAPGMEGLWPIYGGAERLPRYLAIKMLLDQGAVVAFGTDWPLVPFNPMFGLRKALLRQSLNGLPEGGVLPEQRITIAEAIRGYTLDAAYAAHREQDEGSISVGKLADLIVLSDNLLEIDPSDIVNVNVETTMVGGEIVFQASE